MALSMRRVMRAVDEATSGATTRATDGATRDAIGGATMVLAEYKAVSFAIVDDATWEFISAPWNATQEATKWP